MNQFLISCKLNWNINDEISSNDVNLIKGNKVSRVKIIMHRLNAFHAVITMQRVLPRGLRRYMILNCDDTSDINIRHLTHVTWSCQMSTFRARISIKRWSDNYASSYDKNPTAHLDYVACYLNDLSIRMESRLTHENIASELVLCSVDVFQRERTMQTVLCSIPNMAEWNFLHTRITSQCKRFSNDPFLWLLRKKFVNGNDYIYSRVIQQQSNVAICYSWYVMSGLKS